MTTKKKTKKTKAVKPLSPGEVINLPCGGSIRVENLIGGTLTFEIDAVLLSGTTAIGSRYGLKNVRLVVSDDTLKLLPSLTKRALAALK